MPEQRFRISPTGKGAVFRLKRWFYAFLHTSIPENSRKQSKAAWQELVSKLIQELNSRGASDKPARISLSYEIGPSGEFIPLSVKAEVFDLIPAETITLNFSQKALELEKEKIKAHLLELKKRAKELGIEV